MAAAPQRGVCCRPCAWAVLARAPFFPWCFMTSAALSRRPGRRSPRAARAPLARNALLVALAFLLTLVTAAGCGRTIDSELDDGLGGGGTGGAAPKDCGDGTCAPGENCTNCAADCGLCQGCGDSACNNGETCQSCPGDCGVCSSCGNKACDNGENCQSCPQDCGSCESCGNGACDSGETCQSCPKDCGLCQTCGNGACDGAENCQSCAQDCGVCPVSCGDGFCKGGEDCLSCSPDCGVCETCGDGNCNGTTETCFTCQADCGVCPACGDGVCKNNETCASCPVDCLSCSVCGNGVCEQSAFETCSNCPGDCGQCETIGCLQMVGCVLTSGGPNGTGCIEFGGGGFPNVSLTCFANCVAQGCADAQQAVDQFVGCAIQHIPECIGGGGGGVFGCLQEVCGAEFAACISSNCN